MKKNLPSIIIICLIVASLAAFGRITGNGFVNLDDPHYITENVNVQSGFTTQNVNWSLTSYVMGNWHPLTWLSHMLDWSLFGADASGHHLVSLLLHIGAVIFMFLFLNKTTRSIWPSAFAAAFFALHPLRVESVAWAAERKDVLSMFFGMAGIYIYAFYAEKPNLSKYFFCFTAFLMALMSKPMMVTFPFILMLLDFWPLKRWQSAWNEKNRVNAVAGLIGEKIPFICLTILLSFVTLWAQNKVGAVSSIDLLPLATRVNNAIVSYTAYLGKIFLPGGLAVFYPYDFSLPLWKVFFSGFLMMTVTIVVIFYVRKLPFLFVGWFWYVGTMIPVIGLIQVGAHSMADRYTYLPSIGITMMLAWGIPLLFQNFNISKRILSSAAAGVLFTLAFLTWMQCGYWKNDFALFDHALNVTKNNYIAHNHRGVVYGKVGEYQLAIEDFNTAIRFHPGYAIAYYNLGLAYTYLGHHQLAVENYNQAIRLKLDYTDAYLNRGLIFGKQGKHQLAVEDFSKAIRLQPDNIPAYLGRIAAYRNLGQNQLAEEDLNRARKLGHTEPLH